MYDALDPSSLAKFGKAKSAAKNKIKWIKTPLGKKAHAIK
jgi:hypothetical protein